MSDEETLFRGSPSQILNLPIYLASALVMTGIVPLGLLVSPLLFLLGLAPIGFALWKWLELRCRVYEITTQRVRVSQGILTRRTDEMELYRVNDITLLEPFWQRMLGLGDLVLATNDTTNPSLRIRAIRGIHEVRDQMRKHVEICRDRKRVRVTEFE